MGNGAAWQIFRRGRLLLLVRCVYLLNKIEMGTSKTTGIPEFIEKVED